MATLDATIDALHLLGDPTRVRLMALVSQMELTVADLTSILELAQPRVSTHLGRLREAGLVRDRKVGPFTYYSAADAIAVEVRAVWELLKTTVQDDVLDSDKRRAQALLRAREAEAAWPDAVAGQMERHYSPGRTWESTARALLGLVRAGDVLDAGSGDGAIAQLLAPRARSITCLDRSERVVEAARARLERLPNVRVVLGDLHELPLPDESFDQVLLLNVLTSCHTPRQAIAEAARVLRPGGALVVVTLDEHQHPDVTAAYHHVNNGLSPASLRKLMKRVALEVEVCDVAVRERRPPYFQVVHAFASKPAQTS